MLDQIVASKRRELALTMSQTPLAALHRGLPGDPPPRFSERLEQPGIRIIAEIKYRSPSRGEFACKLPPEEVARSYAQAGAAALSVLTDEPYFGGSLANLKAAREALPEIPLLRKDFILDRYQIAEARLHGASAYLLIVACLADGELKSLLGRGAEYQLEALVEVHDAFELETAIESGARLIGVNNRNLKTFDVNLRVSFDLARCLEGESGFVLVSESGIRSRSQILELRDAGFKGFLIGSSLMDSDDPGEALEKLLKS